MGNLAGRVFAVTGASSGIGQRIAETVGGQGAHVFMCGRSRDAMAASQARIEAAGGGATTQVFDITDEQALRGFIDAAAAHGDGLDVLVNNAGVGFTQGTIAEGDPAHWREMLVINVYALLVGCQQAIRVMRAAGRPGRIINVSSTAAIRRDSGVYGATKHAVNCITSTLREELQDDDIRVTSLMPGPFMTNFGRHMDPATVNGIGQMFGLDVSFRTGEKLPPALQQKMLEVASRQMGDPQALADAVVYIARQPSNLGIDEIILRPQKNLSF